MWNLIASIALVFTLAGLTAWWLHGSRRPVHKPNSPAERTPVKIRGIFGVYRCYFQREDGEHWVLAAPLQSDRHVPIRVGEQLVLEIPASDGVQVVRTEVLARSIQDHELRIRRPAKINTVDRRSERRSSEHAGNMVELDGEVAEVIDTSANGIRAYTCARIAPGDRVEVLLPEGRRTGWVLDAMAAAWHGLSSKEVRIAFEPQA